MVLRHGSSTRTSMTHSRNDLCATFLFLPHLEVIYGLLLSRHKVTWNLFVKCTITISRKKAGYLADFRRSQEDTEPHVFQEKHHHLQSPAIERQYNEVMVILLRFI